MPRWMHRSLSAAAVATVTTVVVFVILMLIPTGEYRAVPARPVSLPGVQSTDVYAVAVASPTVAWAILWMERLHVPPLGQVAQAHQRDADAQESRLQAWAAALTVMEKPPAAWKAVTSPSGEVETLLNIRCDAKQRECEANTLSDPAGTVRFADPAVGALTPVLPADAGPPPVATSLSDWTGGSAGLAYALAYVEMLTGEPITPPGMKVAATGGILTAPEQPSYVSAVDAVSEKVHSAAYVDADVFLVPAGEGLQARGGTVPVVEVDTLESALAWLCDHGARNPVCTSIPPSR